MASRVDGPCGGRAKDLKASRHDKGRTCVDIGEVMWQPSKDGRFRWLGLKTTRLVGFPVWTAASKDLLTQLGNDTLQSDFL